MRGEGCRMTKPPDANDILKNGGPDGLRGAFDGAPRAGTNGSNGVGKSTDHNDFSELIAQRAADVAPEPIQWLWPGRVAIGKQTIIAGEAGLGKSQIVSATAAAITTGGDWPCGEGRAPLGNVIILSAEDGVADTIVPRLIAAGADLERVFLVTAVRTIDGNGRTLPRSGRGSLSGSNNASWATLT